MPYNLGYVGTAYNLGYTGTYTGGGVTLDLELTSHGEAHPNSIMAEANFATTGTVLLGVVTDTDQSKVQIDWQAISDGQLWREDINTLDAVNVTATEDTTATFTLAWRVVDTEEEGQFTGTLNIAAPAAAEFLNIASTSDAWAVICQSAGNLSATALASDGHSAIATVNTSIIAAAQASDSAGELPVAVGSLDSVATGNDTLDALANAASALFAGAAAGESWTVQAQVVVDLLEQGVAGDQIRRQTDNAINAAMVGQSAAADQFVAALNAIVSLTESATASDAYVAVVAQLGNIASGAVAQESFSLNFGHVLGLQSGALSGEAWALMVTLTAALSETCTANDLLNAKATVTARVRAGAIATARFAIVNDGIRYLVMGSIILRDALTHRVTIKPH